MLLDGIAAAALAAPERRRLGVVAVQEAAWRSARSATAPATAPSLRSSAGLEAFDDEMECTLHRIEQ
eukprot:5744732-Alexandrium_andersonii.AAC.1